MAYIIGMLTASLSFLMNRALLKMVGPQVIISFSPILEEAAKTLLSYYLGADILAAHVTFGVLEAIYDWLHSEDDKFRAAMFSVAGHGAFGAVTVMLLFLSGSIGLGLCGGMVAHLAWNKAVVMYWG